MIPFQSLFGGGVSPSSSAGLSSNGADTGNTRGEWVVNIAGSGTSTQGASATGTLSPLLIVGLVIVGVLWLKRK